MSKCLYKWIEFGVFLRIMEEGPVNYLETYRNGQWRRIRLVSNTEYNLLFKEKAEAFKRGEVPVKDAPV